MAWRRHRRHSKAPKNADPLNAFATPSSAQSAMAQSAAAKKKKKLARTPGPDHSAAATSAPPATSNDAARQAQNPLTPLYSLINENDTNPGVGPLRRTQNVLLIEPVIPIRLTPDFNLVTRWITPVIRQPALAPTRSVRSLARQPAAAGFLYACTSGGRVCLVRGPQFLASDRDREDVGNQQVGRRTDRRGVVGRGTSDCRRPCQQHVGRDSRVELDRGPCQSAVC